MSVHLFTSKSKAFDENLEEAFDENLKAALH